LDSTTHTDYWLQFLKYCSQPQFGNSTVTLYPHPVLYFNHEAKKQCLNRIHRQQKDGDITPEKAVDMLRDYTQGSTLLSFLREGKGQGVLAIFINELDGNAATRARKLRRNASEGEDWHAYAVFYKEGTLRIYDPARIYISGTDDQVYKQQLKQCSSIPLIRRWVRECRSRKLPILTKIEISGGEGIDSELVGLCQQRTRDWVARRWIEEGMRLLLDLGNKEVGGEDEGGAGNQKEPVWATYV
jgi:hypothetical protein